MRFLTTTLIMLFTLAYVSVQADDVTDILEKCYKATGGKDKINTIESMKIKGTMDMTAQGMSVGIYYVAKKPKMYMENEVMGMKITVGYDGENVWAVNPMAGGQPQTLTGPEAEMTKGQLEGFLNMAALPFENYVEQGIKAEYKGVQETDGKPCHVITFIESDGSQADVFFDSVTYLMYKTQQDSNGQKIETLINDRMKKNGVIYPKSIEIKIDGAVQQKLNFTEIDTNFEVDDNIFSMPK